MSVIVKGMEMPKGSCEWVDAERHLHRCKFLNGDDDCKMQEGMCSDATWEEQFAGCPLVEIPTPHGRLIDADAIDYRNDAMHDGTGHLVVANDFITGILWLIDCIERTPTIIEAEGK